MKVIKWLDEHLEEVLMVLLLIAIAVLMMANVIARRVFQNSLTWSDELSRFLLIWCGFLSVSFCVKKRISIKIDQFQNSLPERWIPFIKMVRHTIVFLFCILMIPYSVTFLQQAIASQATSAAMRLPMYYIQSAPLVCFVLLAIRVAQAWLREFKASWRFMLQTIKDEMKAELLEEMKKREAEEGGSGQ